MLDLFKDFTCRFVLGNGDIDSERINESCENYGFGCVEASSSFEYSGKKFFVFHGDDVPLFRTIVALQEYDYIIKGHTHFFEDYFRNNSHIINPGSVHSIEHTVAVLHIDTDEVEKIVLDEIDLDNEDEQSASYDD
jgi:predicted phosphodiesterase